MSKSNYFLLSLFLLINSFYINLFSQDFSLGSYYAGSRDFLEISYGIGNFKHKRISADFNSLSLTEIKLGRRFLKPMAGYSIIHFSDNYLFSSYIDYYESGKSSLSEKIIFDIWRFGLGYRKGYGYRWGSTALNPYYQMGLVWNRLQIAHPYKNSGIHEEGDYADEIGIIELYDNEIKFGSMNIGGIELQLGSMISLGAAYEATVIFPYHKFWKQFGSFFIETFAQTGIDFLTEGVLIEKVPGITPILYFILKNGLSYYTYTLKQEKMNWPFDTVSPLTMETIKFSAMISF